MNPVVQEPTDDQQNGVLGALFGWIQHPFMTSGIAVNWLLIAILLLVVIWFWNHILLSILDDI